ncbi:MAG: DsbA family protein, partial [Candidatus Pacebacteria bacterium]|nr:DsbA family protein [Candidatus Paceibacterota bacterium]
LAIFFTSQGDRNVDSIVAQENSAEETQQEGKPRPIDATDYIRGNPNAPILIVEYSDYDCPFCKQYHETMNKVIDEFGISGRVAWTYRQFPLSQLHPNSPNISEAALCVGDIGGNDAFWSFTDLIFESRNFDEPTNVTKLPQYAETAGIERSDYITCMEEGRMKESVLASIEDGFNSGARGAPYTVLMVGDQEAIISGAQPYDFVKGVVENLIEQLDGTFDPATETPSDLPAS